MKLPVVLKGTARHYELTNPDVSKRLVGGELVFIDYLIPSGCNLNCLKCFSEAALGHDSALKINGLQTSDLAKSQRADLLNQAINLGVETILVAGVGEPTTSPQLDELVEICSGRGVNLVFFTNGTFLDRKRTEQYLSNGASIIFSIDALDRSRFDLLTASTGLFEKTYNNLVDALEISKHFEERAGNVRVSRVAVNTTPSLITYDPSKGIDELIRFSDLIEERVPHMLTRLSPFGNAAKNWQELAGNSTLERSAALEMAIKEYGCGTVGTSARSNGICAALHNGITTYKGYWMMCPDAGLNITYGRFPEESVASHWKRKKSILAQHSGKSCVSEIVEIG